MIAEDITFRAAIGGIIGAKLYYLIENIPTGQASDNINGLVFNICSGKSYQVCEIVKIINKKINSGSFEFDSYKRKYNDKSKSFCRNKKIFRCSRFL